MVAREERGTRGRVKENGRLRPPAYPYHPPRVTPHPSHHTVKYQPAAHVPILAIPYIDVLDVKGTIRNTNILLHYYFCTWRLRNVDSGICEMSEKSDILEA